MLRVLVSLLLCLSCPLSAETPRVVTDIAPVQSIVARVMEGAGAPSLLIPPGASPHNYAMRPSEARALAGADLVVWIGPELTNWLEGPLQTLGASATHLALLDVPGTVLLDMREGVAFEIDVDDHDHDQVASEDAHVVRRVRDPHAWLDPRNGGVWSLALGETLAAMDPPNAALYRDNAASAAAELAALEAELTAELAPHRDKPFVVLHDAFQYFEARFNIRALAAVVGSDATAPGPARINDLRTRLGKTPVICAFAEPQTAQGLLNTVTEGQGAPIVTLDPMGDSAEPLKQRFSQSLRSIAALMAACLATK